MVFMGPGLRRDDALDRRRGPAEISQRNFQGEVKEDRRRTAPLASCRINLARFTIRRERIENQGA
jgi:hypothetical protein